MKIILVLLSIGFVITTSCQREVDMEKTIKLSNRIIIGQKFTNQIKLDTIDKSSPKGTKLIEFARSNKSRWSHSTATYNFDYWVGLEPSFRLSSWKKSNLVVISFIDSNLKTTQLVKDIESGELDFLIKQ